MPIRAIDDRALRLFLFILFFLFPEGTFRVTYDK